tara:strand:+ start:402 stop:746 length:345 start_codon:yes stop_codon:yes gene_type:complete
MMPIDFPPPEIIEALEEQLNMDFVHFTVTLDGIVEGIFTNGFENQTVSFESKREFVSGFNLPPIENIIAELDPQAIEDMKKMMKSILQEIENNGDNLIEYGGATPRFDGEWYNP